MDDNFYQMMKRSHDLGLLSKGKRADALFRVWKKLGLRAFDESFVQDFLSNIEPNVVVWAPSCRTVGLIKNWENNVVIFLSPLLEFMTMPAVEHTIVHELCHARFKHYDHDKIDIDECRGKPHEQKPHELDTDALAAKLGFPKSRNDHHLRNLRRMMKAYAAKDMGARNRRMFIDALNES